MSENTEKRIEELVSDREKFTDFVYTPLHEAIAELKRRQTDAKLNAYLASLPMEVPEILKNKPSAVLFRHIATPNYEIRRFLHIVSVLADLQPLFLEYTEDKFTNRNECKFSLGKISLYKGMNKKEEPIYEKINIIDINESNCQPISSIKTVWGQSLVDFHHELFLTCFPDYKDNICDFSSWVSQNGKSAKDYYKLFLSLFIKNGILFENFLTENSELSFTKQVVLPAIIEIVEETGVKPLIVALEPTEIEGKHFWQAHPFETGEILAKKMVK
jgi:hypothetical protein